MAAIVMTAVAVAGVEARDVYCYPKAGAVQLRGRAGQAADACIRTRADSDWARGPMYEETVNAFRTHWDDLKSKSGWQNEYWGKTMLCFAGAATYTGDAGLQAWMLEKTHAFLKEFQYPLYFLDFESFQPAIPVYDHTHPYQQIVFQYSLHIRKKPGGKLIHKEYLAMPGEDPRRSVAEHLCKDIPADGSVVVYNQTFEKTRLREMANLFPDLADRLLAIADHIVDLIVPFRKRMYYSAPMMGSYSIKKVLPALYPDDPELDYHSLEGVHNGHEASDAFKQMHSMDADTLQEYRRYLLKYCELDTYAMVKLLNRLYEAVQ
jgi:hypothetical protein